MHNVSTSAAAIQKLKSDQLQQPEVAMRWQTVEKNQLGTLYILLAPTGALIVIVC